MADCMPKNANGTTFCYVSNSTMEQCMPGNYESGAALLGEHHKTCQWPGMGTCQISDIFPFVNFSHNCQHMHIHGLLGLRIHLGEGGRHHVMLRIPCQEKCQ